MRLPEEPRLPSITADATDYDKRLSIRLKELFFCLINKANQFETGSQSIKLGSNSDESKNFLISVPSVADGTLVIERGNGTDVLSIAADGKVSIPGAMVVTGNQQTLQDFTASGSRLLGTTYTNTTDQTIVCMVTASTTVAPANITATVGGVIFAGSIATIAGLGSSVTVAVPPGATYSFNIAATATKAKWLEVR